VIRGQGGTIYTAALPSYRQQVQADIRTRLIHRPARDTILELSFQSIGDLTFIDAGADTRIEFDATNGVTSLASAIPASCRRPTSYLLDPLQPFTAETKQNAAMRERR